MSLKEDADGFPHPRTPAPRTEPLLFDCLRVEVEEEEKKITHFFFHSLTAPSYPPFSQPSRPSMPYGQIVLGPPGSGKTTYVRGVTQYNRLLSRPSYVVNLDPGASFAEKVYGDDENGALVWDVGKECVGIDKVMEETKLGPNGGLMFCMDYVLENIAEIIPRIKEKVLNKYNEENRAKMNCRDTKTWEEVAEAIYVVIDMPGQVELYTHSNVTGESLSVGFGNCRNQFESEQKWQWQWRNCRSSVMFPAILLCSVLLDDLFGDCACS